MFLHLHSHSDYSWDGVSTVNQLVRKAQTENMSALAITDHHSVFSWFDLNKESKKMFVKPLFGMEINVGKHHITAIAMNNKGIENLIRLNNLGYMRNGKPKITEKELFLYQDGIIILSGCSKGKIQKSLYERNFIKALNTAKDYKELMGERFFIEIQRYKEEISGHLNALIQVARKNDISMVPTNDVHYLEKDDAEIYHFILKSNTAGKINATGEHNYFKKSNEMCKLFPKEILENTEKIAARCYTNLEDYYLETYGTDEIPLSMVYRLDDKEALKKSLYARREYRLAEYMYSKMKKQDLTLEDLDVDSAIGDDIIRAYGIRGRISKIEPDPYYYIRADMEKFPIYRKNKNEVFSTQADHFQILEMNFLIEDRRKMKFYMS